MSHGKVVALDTPQNIKRRFGVGYNIFVEAKYDQNRSNEQIKEILDQARPYFEDGSDLEGIKESRDSYDRKLIYLVPMTMIDKIGPIVRNIETNCPEC